MPRGRPNLAGGGVGQGQDADRHVAVRIRERRIMLGLTQQQMAELIGVTYQQAHKYENGLNRTSASRLYQIAQALGVEISYFFEDVEPERRAVEPNAQQRLLLELTRDFVAIPNRKLQEAFCAVARAVAAIEPEADNRARPARASRTGPKPATKAG
jgi:transcriptional regulator with XRE-family HTH domain